MRTDYSMLKASIKRSKDKFVDVTKRVDIDGVYEKIVEDGINLIPIHTDVYATLPEYLAKDLQIYGDSGIKFLFNNDNDLPYNMPVIMASNAWKKIIDLAIEKYKAFDPTFLLDLLDDKGVESPHYNKVIKYIEEKYWSNDNQYHVDYVEMNPDVIGLYRGIIRLGSFMVKRILSASQFTTSLPFEIGSLIRYPFIDRLGMNDLTTALDNFFKNNNIQTVTMNGNTEESLLNFFYDAGIRYRMAAYGESIDVAASKIEKDRLKFMVDSFNVF